jgi:prepilin-type N-terminal cleavage/methylation domain-containing protein
MKHYPQSKFSYGFTLIEVMVSVSIFAIVTTIGIGALLTTNTAYRKAQAQRIVMDALDGAIETMSREIRTGTQYLAGDTPKSVERSNCFTNDDQYPGDPDAANKTAIGFCDAQNNWVVFSLQGDEIMRHGGIYFDEALPLIISDDVSVTDMLFTVIGSDPQDAQQPIVMMRVSGTTSAGATETPFDIQTIVSQRAPDFL